jgi:hypothetical protein
MTTKFIENVKDASPSKTGVKFVKKVEDKRNQIVLYQVPKKRFWRKVGNALKTTFTDPVSLLTKDYYWIAHFYFAKKEMGPPPKIGAIESKGPDKGNSAEWKYGVVKEYRDTTWFLQNTGIRLDNADCIVLTNGKTFESRNLPVYLPHGLGDRLDDEIQTYSSRGSHANCTTANYSYKPIEDIHSDCLDQIFAKFYGR